MVPFRYSVRTLIVVLTLVAVYFPLARFYDSWFASKYGGYYISSVLGFKIRNGDSFKRVASHFGSHRLVGRDHQLAKSSVAELWASKNLTIEDGDEIYRFSTPGGHSAYLQFRDNRLINLKNSTYADARLLAKMNGEALPYGVLTLGFLPLYLVIVALIAILYYFLRRQLPANRLQVDPCKPGADVA